MLYGGGTVRTLAWLVAGMVCLLCASWLQFGEPGLVAGLVLCGCGSVAMAGRQASSERSG